MVIESKKEELLTREVQKRLVWELMEGWGQPSQELGEGFPDKGSSKHKSPERRKSVEYSRSCQRSVSLVERGGEKRRKQRSRARTFGALQALERSRVLLQVQREPIKGFQDPHGVIRFMFLKRHS